MASIFVYGTLRRGGSNHFRMEGAQLLSTATVKGRLYRIDWYPGLVLDDSAGDVVGEIYQVSEALLGALDSFEGAEYRRVREMAASPSNHRSTFSVWVWEWLGPVDESRRISSGDWLEPG